MKRMGKKGQGAMEYLMTYGWAILVVMIVGVVLWQLGIFGGGASGNKATGFIGSKIGVIDASIKCNTSTLSFIVTNQAGATLSNVDINVESGDCSDAASTFNLSASSNHLVELGSCSASVGDTLQSNLNITFTERVAGTSINRVQRGTIFCTVE